MRPPKPPGNPQNRQGTSLPDKFDRVFLDSLRKSNDLAQQQAEFLRQIVERSEGRGNVLGGGVVQQATAAMGQKVVTSASQSANTLPPSLTNSFKPIIDMGMRMPDLVKAMTAQEDAARETASVFDQLTDAVHAALGPLEQFRAVPGKKALPETGAAPTRRLLGDKPGEDFSGIFDGLKDDITKAIEATRITEAAKAAEAAEADKTFKVQGDTPEPAKTDEPYRIAGEPEKKPTVEPEPAPALQPLDTGTRRRRTPAASNDTTFNQAVADAVGFQQPGEGELPGLLPPQANVTAPTAPSTPPPDEPAPALAPVPLRDRKHTVDHTPITPDASDVLEPLKPRRAPEPEAAPFDVSGLTEALQAEQGATSATPSAPTQAPSGFNFGELVKGIADAVREGLDILPDELGKILEPGESTAEAPAKPANDLPRLQEFADQEGGTLRDRKGKVPALLPPEKNESPLPALEEVPTKKPRLKPIDAGELGAEDVVAPTLGAEDEVGPQKLGRRDQSPQGGLLDDAIKPLADAVRAAMKATGLGEENEGLTAKEYGARHKKRQKDQEEKSEKNAESEEGDSQGGLSGLSGMLKGILGGGKKDGGGKGGAGSDIGKVIGGVAGGAEGGPAGAEAGEAVGGLLGSLTDVGGMLKSTFDTVMKPINQLTEVVGSVVSTFQQVVQVAASYVQALNPSAVMMLNQAQRDLSAAIGTGLLPIVQGATQVLRDLGSVILPISQTLAPVIDRAVGAFQVVADSVFKLVGQFADAVIPLGEAFATLLEGLAPVGSMLASVGQMIVAAFTPAISIIAELIKGLGSFLGWFGALEPIFSTVTAIVSGFAEVMRSMVQGISKWLGSLFGSVGKDWFAGVKEALATFGKYLLLAVGNIARFIGATSMIEGMIKGLRGGAERKSAAGLAAPQNVQTVTDFAEIGKMVSRASVMAAKGAFGKKPESDTEYLKSMVSELEKLREGQSTVLGEALEAAGTVFREWLDEKFREYWEGAKKKVYDVASHPGKSFVDYSKAALGVGWKIGE